MLEIGVIATKLEQSCSDKGIKLTNKRLNVLSSLTACKQAMSAYELAEQYRSDFGQAIPAMSIYRILDYLVEHSLVHKLSSANKYVACSHLTCEHDHAVPQFLICTGCNSVTEIALSKTVMDELRGSVEKTGFKLAADQLELNGFCKNCQ